MSLNPLSLIPLLASISIGSLGAFCFYRNHESRIHRVFFYLCAAFVSWPFALGVFLNLESPKDVVWWTKLGHMTCTLAPAIYLDFTATFLKLSRLRSFVRACYVYVVCTISIMWFTDWYFNGEIIRYAWGPYAKGGWLASVDAIFGLLLISYSFSLLLRALRQARGHADTLYYDRTRYITLAMGVCAFAMMDYLPKYNIPIFPLGSLAILSFAAITTYAIIRHQILDFTLAIRRTAVYSILAALITATYLVAILVMEKWFQGFFGYRSIVATSVVGFGTALGFTPLKNWVQQFVDQYFFKKSPEALAEENEQLRKQVERTERLKAVATLAAGMAHEIKNPLASIKTFAEYLPEKFDDPAFREKFAKIMGQEVDKMNALVQRLLEFAKPSPPQLGPVKVSDAMKETLEFIHGTLLNRQIQIDASLSEDDEVKADAAQLKQVFLNILLNSVEAMDHPGRITISTARENGHLQVTVADTGPGIAPKDLQHVFDPFYTTKPGGTGLGLSVVHSIIRQHGGRINVKSTVGKGTTVEIQLPANGVATRDPRPATRDSG